MAKKLVFSLFFALPALAAPEFLPFGLAGVSKTQVRRILRPKNHEISSKNDFFSTFFRCKTKKEEKKKNRS
jgi:hypothetical protein